MAVLGERLWIPDERFCREAELTKYLAWLAEHRNLEFADYRDLWRWSIADLDVFWRSIWDYFGLGHKLGEGPLLTSRQMPGATWCPGVKVNFAAHLLSRGPDGQTAIEHFSECREPGSLTWSELREQVAHVARGLTALGVRPGDRVAAFLPNTPEAVVAMLATTAIGAVWSSCSPDFGVNSALDRFRQIEPKVLIAVDGYRYGGKDFDRRPAVRELLASLPAVERVVHLGYLFPSEPGPAAGAIDWHALASGKIESGAAGDTGAYPEFDFDHPLWIVYSSGTTGLPKGMVHGHGGVLIEQLKTQHLHLNLNDRSCLFFYTTTGWIMFNLLVSALLAGTRIVLYDGNPAYPDFSALWRMVEQTRATNFGTSPTFVNLLAQNQICPRDEFDLGELRNVLCTGSPLTPESFSWLYENVKENLWVSSISGGTDIAAGFVGGVVTEPVHSGEIQGPCLGVDVQAFDPNGQPVVEEEGELVVTQPMPSMPLYFWNDPDGKRYHESYFDTYPGVWRHGDLLKVTDRGTYVIAGRSDSTLNRHGIRIGTSEVYRTVEALPEVVDSLVVHLAPAQEEDELILFVSLADGASLDHELETRIRTALRAERSPRHVPEAIVQVAEVPYTLTGKKMEVPVKRILEGAEAARVANVDAMANPASIEPFVTYAASRRASQDEHGTDESPRSA